MSAMDKINRLAATRQQNWAAYPHVDPQLTYDATAALGDMWARIREDRARARYGSRQDIQRRAMVERELERLISRA